jgi:transposase
VSLIAREHDINANLVFRWRHQYQEGLFGPVNHSATLLPIQVIEAPAALPQVVQPQPECHSEIVVELGKATREPGSPKDPDQSVVREKYVLLPL